MLNLDSSVPIDHDYEQVQSDMQSEETLYHQYAGLYTHLLQMINEMKGRHMSPDLIINFFMYQMMPDILQKGEDELSIMGDQMNVLSDYRSLVSEAQSAFNQFNNGDGTQQDFDTITTALSEIQQGLSLDTSMGGIVLDSGTVAQMTTAIATIKSLFDGKTGSDAAQYLNNLWPSASQPSDPGSGNYVNNQNAWIAGASETIKSFGEQFNTINTGSSTVSQAKQTQIEYDSSSFQQFLGLDNNLLQNRAKQVSALVQNQKTS